MMTDTTAPRAGATNTPTASLITAAVRLADVLQTENAALAALNMPAAVRLLPEKLAAADAFVAAQAGGGAKEPQAARHRIELKAVARRLQALAVENQRLLERAMLVQTRVIATVAKAARATAEREAPGYGASHGVRAAPRLAACAVATQA
ncbi:MAG: hypothetical protein JO157_04760 [Acetobacteraceae bacterium]|nr:hypothetical protein [Acetobacteraceae bacterium]